MAKENCKMYHKLLDKDDKCRVCGKNIYIPNWFDKKNMEELTGEKVTSKQFDDFIEYMNDFFQDEVSGLVRDSWNEWKTNSPAN
jgi:hypothetical protein